MARWRRSSVGESPDVVEAARTARAAAGTAAGMEAGGMALGPAAAWPGAEVERGAAAGAAARQQPNGAAAMVAGASRVYSSPAAEQAAQGEQRYGDVGGAGAFDDGPGSGASSGGGGSSGGPGRQLRGLWRKLLSPPQGRQLPGSCGVADEVAAVGRGQDSNADDRCLTKDDQRRTA